MGTHFNASCYLSFVVVVVFVVIVVVQNCHSLLNVFTVIEEFCCFYLQKRQFINLR
jgi:hypothetical protein